MQLNFPTPVYYYAISEPFILLLKYCEIDISDYLLMVEQFSSRETKLVGEGKKKRKRKERTKFETKAMSFKFIPLLLYFFSLTKIRNCKIEIYSFCFIFFFVSFYFVFFFAIDSTRILAMRMPWEKYFLQNGLRKYRHDFSPVNDGYDRYRNIFFCSKNHR